MIPSQDIPDFRDVPRQAQSCKWQKADFPEQAGEAFPQQLSRAEKGAFRGGNEAALGSDSDTQLLQSLLSGMRPGLKVNQLAQLQARTKRKNTQIPLGWFVCLFGILRGRGRFQAPCPI